MPLGVKLEISKTICDEYIQNNYKYIITFFFFFVRE